MQRLPLQNCDSNFELNSKGSLPGHSARSTFAIETIAGSGDARHLQMSHRGLLCGWASFRESHCGLGRLAGDHLASTCETGCGATG